MAFFGLTDITFTNEQNRNGPLAPLFTNRKLTNTFRYPLDIGNYDKGHYMVIHINKQQNSQFTGVSQKLNDPTQTPLSKIDPKKSISNFKEKFSSGINKVIDNGVASISRSTNGALSWLQPSGPSFNANEAAKSTNNKEYIDSVKSIEDKSLLKTTIETTDSVVLYMPDTMAFTSAQNYEQLELGSEPAGKIAEVGKSLIETMQKNGMKAAGEQAFGAIKAAAATEITKAIGSAVGSGGTGKLAAFALTGGVVNPQLEVLYTSPSFRSFQFSFNFFPRDEREALEVQNIIERLRFHQAPELKQDTAGFLMIPPSEFEIEFYYGGQQNPNIPPIGRCVLKNIDVNYAPAGWSSFEMPGENKPQLGRTGMPTAITLTLDFQEVIILTKKSFRNQNDLQNGSDTFRRAQQ